MECKKLLVIAPQHVIPPTDGGRAGILYPLREFARHYQVFFAFPQPIDGPTEKDLENLYREIGVTPLVLPSAHREGLWDVLRNTVEDLPFKIRKYFNPKALAKLESLVTDERIQSLWINHLHQVPYALALKQRFGCRFYLREHNIESDMYLQYEEQHASPGHRLVARWQHRKALLFERIAWKEAERVFFISDSDLLRARSLGWTGSFESLLYDIIPLSECRGDDWNQADSRAIVCPLRLTAIQNQFNARWFLHEVWPTFHANNPEFRLVVTGCMPGDVARDVGLSLERQRSLSIAVVGMVEDYLGFLHKYRYFVSPTVFGSGVRLKLIEAMGQGCLCLCSDLDLKSIRHFEDRKHLAAFCNAESFEAAIRTMEQDSALRASMRAAAKDLARGLFAPESYVRTILASIG